MVERNKQSLATLGIDQVRPPRACMTHGLACDPLYSGEVPMRHQAEICVAKLRQVCNGSVALKPNPVSLRQLSNHAQGPCKDGFRHNQGLL